MLQRAIRTMTLRHPALLATLLLAGCAGMGKLEGTGAELAEAAAAVPVLTAASGKDAASVARNGLLRSPAVREAASRVSASSDEVRVQRAVLFPSLGLSLGGGTGTAGKGQPALDLEGEQLILDFGDTKRAVTIADLQLQMNYIDFQKSVDDTLVELLIAYDAVRKYGALNAVRRKQLEAMRELARLVAERAESGAAATPDLLETRKRIHSAEFELHDTGLALAEARDRLVRLSGQESGGSVRLPASAAQCSTPGGSADMRLAQLGLQQAAIRLQRAERARLPRISLSPLARAQRGQDGVKLGLNVGLNSDLMQGGALTARANAARNAEAGAAAAVAAAELDTAIDTRKLARDIAAGSRKSDMLRRQIELLTETRDLYRSQYFDLGTRQLSDLLDNEDEYYNRQAELIELGSAMLASRLDCAVAGGNLRRAMGIADNSLHGFPLALDLR